ncbi:hypothetical protein [Jiangella anatolica]|nr:hypothetical protein [Jiangella anatolica]
MATKRKLLLNRGGSFHRTVTGTQAVWDETVKDPTDAEVADLLARVLEAAGHHLPTIPADYSSGYYLEQLLLDLAAYRDALARDAEKAEREQAEKLQIEALSLALSVNGGTPVWREIAKRAYELGARA